MESNDTPEPLFNFKYTIARKDIPVFVNELRKIQENMIEAVVESKVRQGYPEANEVIKHIMEKK
jgi:hypothetical protein